MKEVTHSFCCVYEEDDTIGDPHAGCDLVREVNVAFEGDTRHQVTFQGYLSELTSTDKNIEEARCTWRVHDVKKIRFSSGVRQDHCDGGALDTHSSLLRKKNTKIG